MRYFLTAMLLAIATAAGAVDYEFLGGSTDKFILVNMYDTDGVAKTGLAYTDVTVTYTRNNGAADVDVTEATMTIGTHVDGGWAEVDATNSPGLYQFGIPDAAIAGGAESVVFSFKATSTFQRFVHASLISVDLRASAYVAANTVQIEGSDATDQINAQADAALVDYDPPTNAEMEARTLVAANYFDFTTDSVTTDTASRNASKADVSALATAADLATVDGNVDLILEDTGTTLPATLSGLATASALSTAQGDISSILTDTGELQTRFANMIEADGLDWRFTANALEQGPSGGGGGGDATAANQTTIINHLLGIKGGTWDSGDSLEAIFNQGTTAQADLDTLTGSDGVTLATSQPNYAPNTTTPPTVGQIRTELETAGGSIALILEDTGTTLPGTLSSLNSALSTHDGKLDTADANIDLVLADTGELQTRFANMIEADGVDWRYTTNALEQAPAGGGGGGGDATAANQTTIITHLTDIKGATFNTSTDSLEAIRNQGDAAWGSGGAGDTVVNHDTGGTDALRFVDGSGAGIEAALIMAYVKEDYDAGIFTLRGQATTNAEGRWASNLLLNSGVEYTLVFYKPGAFGPTTTDVTP